MARPTVKGNSQLSAKHVLIDKANSYLIVASAVATVIVVFSIFASIEIINKISYQNKVISLRKEARDQLQENIESVETLNAAYITFDQAEESIVATSEKNSKIVLDALPSKYDFPAFITSLEFIIQASGLSIENIDGQDEETSAEESLINPQEVEIPFEISAQGNYEAIQRLVDTLQRSIRPFNISEIEISGEGDSLDVRIVGTSYYQPAKEIGIVEQVVKSDENFTLEVESTEAGAD